MNVGFSAVLSFKNPRGDHLAGPQDLMADRAMTFLWGIGRFCLVTKGTAINFHNFIGGGSGKNRGTDFLPRLKQLSAKRTASVGPLGLGSQARLPRGILLTACASTQEQKSQQQRQKPCRKNQQRNVHRSNHKREGLAMLVPLCHDLF